MLSIKLGDKKKTKNVNRVDFFFLNEMVQLVRVHLFSICGIPYPRKVSRALLRNSVSRSSSS